MREGQNSALCVVHTFHDAPESITVPIPKGFRVNNVCARDGIHWTQSDRELQLSALRELDGAALLLTRE